MQIIIAGCERVGAYLAHKLYEMGHDLIVIEDKAESLEGVEDIDCLKIQAKAIDVEAQRRAGAETADALICTSSNENINVMAAEVAQVIFNVPKVIVRTLNPLNNDVFMDMGLNTVCSTEVQAEAMLDNLFSNKQELRLQIFGHNLLVRREPLNPAFYDKELAFAEEILGQRVSALERGGRLILGRDELRLRKGDYLLLYANEENQE